MKDRGALLERATMAIASINESLSLNAQDEKLDHVDELSTLWPR